MTGPRHAIATVVATAGVLAYGAGGGLLAGCQPPVPDTGARPSLQESGFAIPPGKGGVSPLTGRIERVFLRTSGLTRPAQALMTHVANGATVSLIESATGRTVSTAVSSDDGAFGLTSFWDGGWKSLTNTTPGVGIVVSAGTTAIATLASLRQSAGQAVDLSTLIGKVSGTAFDDSGTGLSRDADFAPVLSLVGQA